MKIPSNIRAGDTIKWTDPPTQDTLGNPVSNATHSLIYYLRFNANHEGVTVVDTHSGSDWLFTISATTSAGMDPGTWYFQAVATALVGSHKTTLGSGQLTVAPNLAYTGQPGAFDGRSQAEKDLEAVETAIRSLSSGGGVQEYRIGTRSLKRYDMGDLLVLRDRLKAQVVREQKANMIANGLGNPHSVFIRFGSR